MSFRWGLQIHIAAADVAIAFDSLSHDALGRSLQNSGIHPELVACLLRELVGCSAAITLPGAGRSKTFPFQRGGKQVGVETPDLFNIIMDALMSPLVRSWQDRGYGVLLEACPQGITHIVWADNIFLLSTEISHIQIMSQELALALHEYKFRLKPSSLQILTDSDVEVKVTAPSDEPLTFSKVSQLEALGCILDMKGSTAESFQHRLAKGESCCRAQMKTLTGIGRVASKLAGWHAGPAASVLHCSSTWHVTKNLLVTLKRWEFNHLRKVFRLRRRQDEGQMEYNRRTSKRISEWSRGSRFKLLHHRVLLAIFKAAWREEHLKPPGGDNLLKACRCFRNRAW